MQISGHGKWISCATAVRVLWMAMSLVLISQPVKASEQRVSVDASHVRETLTEYVPRVHGAKVRLKDNSVVMAKRVNAESDALRLNAGGGVSDRLIPYTEVASIRLELGAIRGWKVADGILLGVVGLGMGAFATQESSRSASGTGLFVGMGVGAVVGTKLGSRHRNILVIEMK